MAARERKERRESLPFGEVRWLEISGAQSILSNPKTIAAKIDEDAVLHSRRFQVAEQLRNVLTDNCSDSLQLDNNHVFNKEICKIFPDYRPVLFRDRQRMLLNDLETGLSEPMRQRIFVNLFQVAVPMKHMNVISILTDDPAKPPDFVGYNCSSSFLCSLCSLAAILPERTGARCTDAAFPQTDTLHSSLNCVTMCHNSMKTVSIRELHARTGAIVREAAKRPLQVTDRGRVLAVIQAPGAAARQGVPLPEREEWIAGLPRQMSDSAALIGEDRDR